ncbi:Armadillo-like helical [Artemisia annua]|uniref:Armadillo-like helical n=1 Tax=Artemisia annua TaxID=35608 RepID=A0A2U1N2F7_ARTAN|nr:Armadillo-like helical [Artemisia annua]
MSPQKHTQTQTTSSRDFKHHLLTTLTKLSDRDTHASASTELESIAKNLTHDKLSPFISQIIITNASDKSFVRKQCLRLISTLCDSHGHALSPYVSKLINAVIKRLRDTDSSVRSACVGAAGSVTKVTKVTFLSVVKPFVEALVTEQDCHAQIGAALCVGAVVSQAAVKDEAYLRSEDWSVRKGACEVLEKLAVVEGEFCKEFKRSCLKTFEAKRFDKVKSVRETMNQMIEAWNAIPDVAEELSDRDTHASASTELESIAKTLTYDKLSPFISQIIITNSSDKSFVRKQCLRLISTLCEVHGHALSPYVPKLINAVIKRLRDTDSSVRSACVGAAGSVAKVTKVTFLSVVKPFVEALVTEQDCHAQIGAALCVGAVVSHAAVKDEAYLRRLVPRVERLLKSDAFKAKAALLSVVRCLISVGCCDGALVVKGLVDLMVGFVVKSEDWSVRKGACEVLEKLAVVEGEFCKEFKRSCLKTFEAKRFDKVKSVRETMNQMIEAWNAIPDVAEEVSPQPESHSSKEVDALAPRTPQMMSRRSVPYGSSSSTSTRRNSFESNSKKTGPAMFRKLDRKKPNERKLDSTVATPPSPTLVTKDEGSLKHRSRKHEIKRVLFNEISEEKTFESQYHDERSNSVVVDSNANLEINVVQQESEDLSLIRNQLAQIETRQSNLCDLLEKFIGSSQNGMRSLESRVLGLESTLDEISFDLAKTSGRLSNPEPTLCCKFPGADLLSSKLWKKTETRHMTIKNTNCESYNIQNTGFRLQASGSGLIKNPLAEAHQM